MSECVATPAHPYVTSVARELMDVPPATLAEIRSQGDFIAKDYEGRYPYELIQNADDACRRSSTAGIATIGRVRFIVDQGALTVANDGHPFDERDLDSICRTGLSTKAGDGVGLGHKGLGFKSVLMLTDNPQISSAPNSECVGGACRFHFDRESAYRTYADHLRARGFAGRDQLQRWFPSATSLPPRFPVAWSPSLEVHRVIDRLHDEGFVNVFRLPFKSLIDSATVVNVLKATLDDAVGFLPFLSTIKRIELQLPGGESAAAAVESLSYEAATAVDFARRARGVETRVSRAGEGRRYMVFRSGPLEAATLTVDRSAFQLPDEWPVTVATITVAVPLEDSGRTPMLHLGFPTLAPSGTGLWIHADFYTDLARKHLPVGEKEGGAARYNRWLLDRVATFVADVVLPEMTAWCGRDLDRACIFSRALAVRGAFLPMGPSASPGTPGGVFAGALLAKLASKRVLPSAVAHEFRVPAELRQARTTRFTADLRLAASDSPELDTLLALPLQADSLVTGFAAALGCRDIELSGLRRILVSRPPRGPDACRAAVRMAMELCPAPLSDDARSSIQELPVLAVADEAAGVPARDATRRIFFAQRAHAPIEIPECVRRAVEFLDPEFQFGTSGEHPEMVWLRNNRIIEDFDGPAVVEAAMSAVRGTSLHPAQLRDLLVFFQRVLDPNRVRGDGAERVRNAVADLLLPARDAVGATVQTPAGDVYLGRGWYGGDEGYNLLARAWRGLPETSFLDASHFTELLGKPPTDSTAVAVEWLPFLTRFVGLRDSPRTLHRMSRGSAEQVLGKDLSSTPFPHELRGRTVGGDAWRTRLWAEYRAAFYSPGGSAMVDEGRLDSYRPANSKVLVESICLDRFEDVLAVGSDEIGSSDPDVHAQGRERLDALFVALRRAWPRYAPLLRSARINWNYRGWRPTPGVAYFAYALRSAPWIATSTEARPPGTALAGSDLERAQFPMPEMPFGPSAAPGEMELALGLPGISSAPARTLVAVLNELANGFDAERFREPSRRSQLLKTVRNLYSLLNKRCLREPAERGDLGSLKALLCRTPAGFGSRFAALPPLGDRAKSPTIWYDPRGLGEIARAAVSVFQFLFDEVEHGALLSALGVPSLASIVSLVPELDDPEALVNESARLEARIAKYYGPYLLALVHHGRGNPRKLEVIRFRRLRVILGRRLRVREKVGGTVVGDPAGRHVDGFLERSGPDPVLYLCEGFDRRDPFLLAGLLASLFTDLRRETEFQLLLSVLDERAPEVERQMRARTWLVNEQELDPDVLDRALAGDAAEGVVESPTRPPPVRPPVTPPNAPVEPIERPSDDMGPAVPMPPPHVIADMLADATTIEPIPGKLPVNSSAPTVGGTAPRRPPKPDARLGRLAEDWIEAWLVETYGRDRIRRYGHADDGHLLPDGKPVGADFVITDADGRALKFIEAKGARWNAHLIVMTPSEWDRAEIEGDRYELHLVVFSSPTEAVRRCLVDPVGAYDRGVLPVTERVERWIFLSP